MRYRNYNIKKSGDLRIIEKIDFPRINVKVDCSGALPGISEVHLVDRQTPPYKIKTVLAEVNEIIESFCTKGGKIN
jgi:hypothetical protein